MARFLIRLFLISAGCILLCTGLLKVLSSLTETKVLGLNDPLFSFLSNRQMLFLVGALELALSRIILSRRTDMMRAATVAWISGAFLMYRLGLWSISFHEPCACLGRAGDWLHLEPTTVDSIMRGILAYLLCGSVCALLVLWWEKRPRMPSSCISEPAK